MISWTPAHPRDGLETSLAILMQATSCSVLGSKEGVILRPGAVAHSSAVEVCGVAPIDPRKHQKALRHGFSDTR